MDKTKLIKEVESIWEEMGCSWDEGYSISGHTLNKIVSRAYDNVSEKSSDISPIIGRLPIGTKVNYEGMVLTVKTNHEDFNQEPAYRMEGKPDEMFINTDFEALIADDL